MTRMACEQLLVVSHLSATVVCGACVSITRHARAGAPGSQSPASRLTLTESAKPRLSAVPAASITTVVQDDAGKTRGVTAVRALG